MEEIIDRKRSSIQGREASLAAYIHILMSKYALSEIEHKTGELYPALLKSVKTESSERETSLALRGRFLLGPLSLNKDSSQCL
jgi:Interferon-related developmental regulator (IFRD)